MRIAMFYNEPSEDAALDADDVLVQLKAVAAALRRLGHAAGKVSLRHEAVAVDRDAVREIVAATGVFSEVEIEVAVELVDERLAKGAASGYEFIFAERGGAPLGYACYGPIPLTQASYDLYWVAVRPECQGQGIVRMLLQATERMVCAAGGQRVFIETSSRDPYAAARAFYANNGYEQIAALDDFYLPGDAKVIFAKRL